MNQTLLITIPLTLGADVGPTSVARAMVALEQLLADTLIAEGVRVGTPQSAIVPTEMLEAARRAS